MIEGVIIVDGTYVVHRAYAVAYAHKQADADDHATLAATVALASVMVSRLTLPEKTWDRASTYIAFDHAGDSGRRAIYPDYKKKRRPRHQIITDATAVLAVAFKRLGLRVVGDDQHEADDWIASICRRSLQNSVPQRPVVIVSGDHDLRQLIEASVTLRIPTGRVSDEGARGYRRYDINSFYSEYQFMPHRLTDYKALAGDSSDDLPGVPGIGKTWAQRLVVAFGGLDDIYLNVGTLQRASLRDALQRGKSDAYMFKRLATLINDLPLTDQERR